MPATETGAEAPKELARILGRAPPVAEAPLRDQTLLTTPWDHGALHDYLPSLRGNVIITYYGEPQDIVWRRGGERLAGKTRTGTITIIPEGHAGRWDIAGPIGVSHVFLPTERISSVTEHLEAGDKIELLGRVGFDDPVAARVMQLLGRDASHSTEPAARLFVEQATDLLVTQLVRGHSTYGAFDPPVTRGLAGWQVRKVDDFMREHLEEPIGLDVLANLVGLSRFHFCTAYKQATGATPYATLVGLRMAEARRLLAARELPITQIALAVGYSTPSAFTAAFRKHFGQTPSEFRHQL